MFTFSNLNSCRSPRRYHTDPKFSPYIQEFEEHYDIDISNVPIFFDSFEFNLVVGVCIIWEDNDDREIRINEYWWELLTDKQKEQLIFHELGHCVFDRKHYNIHTIFQINKNIVLCPASIMRSFMFSELEIEYCYVPLRDYYLKELRYGGDLDHD